MADLRRIVLDHSRSHLSVVRLAASKAGIELEHILGVRLLHRTTRRVGTTEAELADYERYIDILARVVEAEMQVTRPHGEPRGVLKLNGPASFGALYLAPPFPSSWANIRNSRSS